MIRPTGDRQRMLVTSADLSLSEATKTNLVTFSGIIGDFYFGNYFSYCFSAVAVVREQQRKVFKGGHNFYC